MKIHVHLDNLEKYKAFLKFKDAVRSFFLLNNYLELDLPIVSPVLIPESGLEVFETEYKYKQSKQNLYLTPSPELFIKRLIVSGVNDCFYLGKSFRNDELVSRKHSFEFQILEFYKIGVDYIQFSEIVLQLLQFLAKTFFKNQEIVYQNKKILFDKLEQITVADAFHKYAGINSDELFDEVKFLEKAASKKYQTNGFNYVDLWSQIYAQEVEPNLGKNGRATIIYDFPIQFASLAQPNEDGQTAKRFELYIEGIEIGNCFSELTDYKIQKNRFDKEQQERKISGKIEHQIDSEFISYLEKGMPSCSGIAIGIERLGLIFCNCDNINELKILDIY